MLRVGITCYPSIGGSGILASALGEELAARGHEVHFISYERPVRVPLNAERVHFHPVAINDYGLFRYPDYTLPLSVKMAETAEQFHLDVLHVHYAVPHATAALLARSMLQAAGVRVPKIVTTLHGTDTTLLGRDAGYGPAIRHGLVQSDVVTAVSAFLRDETRSLLDLKRPIEVIPNFFSPKPCRRSREDVRRELGVAPDECLVFHASNLRPLKRVDLVLQAASALPAGSRFKLLILAGGDFGPFLPLVSQLGLSDRLIVRQGETELEDYLQASDVSLYASESESFCLGILEGMAFGCPAVAFGVGGIPEVVDEGKTGLLAPYADVAALTRALQNLVANGDRRKDFGDAARLTARSKFSSASVVPRYEAIYS